jgi:glycosyltransferase involved in cell wall biosynthesis
MSETVGAAVTVCIPNYNHGRFIGEALESVLTQSLPPAEVIVIDDASTDDSVAVVERIAAQHANVRLIRKSVNSGVFESTARGLAESTGEFFFLLAADDRVLPGFFERSIALLREHPEAGMCGVGFRFIDAESKVVKRQDLPTFHTHLEHAQDVQPFLSPAAVVERLDRQPWFLGGTASVMFRRDAFRDAGGLNGDLGLFADWFVVHCVALRHGMCYITAPLCEFRMLPGSYGTAIILRPRAALDCAAATLRLMSSERFARVFPPDFVERKRRELSYSSFRSALIYSQTSFLRDVRELVPPRGLLDRFMLFLMRAARNAQWVVLKLYCQGKVAIPLDDQT